MAEPTRQLATYADLEAVPPHLIAEIIDGALVTHPMPSPLCALAATALGAKIGATYLWREGGLGDYIFMHKPELHLGDHVLVPDIAGWRNDRIQTVLDDAHVKIAPDWVCEVLSDATKLHDRGAKRRIYAEAGAMHLWLLDPHIKLLEVFTLVNGKWALAETYVDAETVRATPFEAASFPLDLLWPIEQAPPISSED